jgi:signal transduction histidine kinase/ligand-binding sensor domain-containing protein
MHRALLALAVSGLLTPAAARAERLPIRAYTTADGLAHNTVNRIVRDSRGFLWFATDDGLSRFDGYAFTNYGVEQGLPHPRVMDLLETRNGELWVATFGGLVRFRPDGVQNERVSYANEAGGATPMFATILPADEHPGARAVLRLLESRDGTIWCGTREGLVRLERGDGRFELRPIAIGLPDEYPEQKYVKDLVEDDHESLWIAAPSGLYRRWRDGTAAHYDVPDLFRRDRALGAYRDYYHLHDLLKDHQGGIWVGSRALGFFRMTADGSRRAPVVVEHYGYPDPFASWIDEVLETSDGRFWAASNLGLIELSSPERLHGSRLVIHNRSHGLINEALRALAEDMNGNLWIGTGGAGAMKVARGGFVTYGRSDGIAQGDAVLEDASGQLYVLAHVFRTGLLGNYTSATPEDELEVPQFGRFDGRRFEWFMPGKPFWLGWVMEKSVLRTRNNEWWLAGGTGLFRYGPHPTFIGLKTAKPLRVFTEKDGLSEFPQVYRMFEDSRTDVWFSIISKTNGLFRWSRATDTMRNMAAVEGFPRVEDELPRAMGEDRDGNVWIGLNNGVARYRNGTFAFFKMANGLPLGAIVDIHADGSRRLWLASARTGLVRVDDPAADPPAFTRFTTADGLSGNSLAVITEDLQGRLYLATGRGIDQLDPRTGAVRQFTTEDGLSAGVTICASRDRNGALWFGTTTGLSRFVPPANAALTAPAILITGIAIGGRPWPVSAIGETSVTLPGLHPGAGHVQIDFASLRFAVGERLRYQYRLGSDEEWSPPTSRRTVSFASFSPGTYRFLVRAVNADGLTSPQPAIVAFTVLPPFWMRWWFVTLTTLALASTALALHRYRLARVLELERVRARIATDLHDDVGANLTRIAILSEAARQQRRAGASSLDGPLSSIADIARESVATMSDIVWAISPERDTLDDMVRRMRDHAEEVFESPDIRLILELPDVVPPSRLGVDVRRDFYLIFKEAVNNAARHSRCSNVGIALRADGARLRLEVTDDGIGFDPRGQSDGNGLANMKRRAARLGATLEVLTEPGVGTTVRLTMVPANWRPTRTIPTRTGR